MRSIGTPAEKFWVGLGAYIIIADIYLWRNRRDTMSVQFGKWLDTKTGKTACIITTATIVGHLYIGVPLPLQAKAKRYLGGIL